jgi:hypothetical protein
MVLDKMPVNESIFWIGEGWLNRIWHNNYGNLSLPDDKTVNEIKSYCIQKGLAITVSD